MDNLQELRDMTTKTINASVFSAVFNALSIEYGQTGSISIVIRNRKATTETLIQIKPYHTNGILTPKVNVGAKYGVLNRTLSERIPRLATGAVVKNIPKANAYVVLYVPEMLDQTAIMQFNDDKYYLEWSYRGTQNEGSAEVCVSSQHSYRNRLALEGRDLIRNPRFLYTGEFKVERPTAQSQVLKSESDGTISPSDERKTETPAPSTSSVPTQKEKPIEVDETKEEENNDSELDDDTVELLEEAFAERAASPDCIIVNSDTDSQSNSEREMEGIEQKRPITTFGLEPVAYEPKNEEK